MKPFIERLVQLSTNLYITESEMKQEKLEQRSTYIALQQQILESKARKINISSGEDAFI